VSILPLNKILNGCFERNCLFSQLSLVIKQTQSNSQF
jgi:hypothetical protein